MWLSIIVYVLLSFRYLYKQSWIKTITKTVIAFFYMMFLTMVGFVVAVIISVSLNQSVGNITRLDLGSIVPLFDLQAVDWFYKSSP